MTPVTLKEIEAARDRISPYVFRTPLRRSEWLSEPVSEVWLKLEVVQPTCSFKIRGAVNAALLAGDAPLVTASAGNHGRALAHACRILGRPLTVFIAAGAPRAKIDAIRALGADLRACRDYDEAEREAKRHAASGAGTFISPYSHPDVIAGAGTIALELLEDAPQIGAVVVPIGGGGLVSGIAIGIKALSPDTRIIGVEVAASSPFTASRKAGRLTSIEVQDSLADGLTGNLDPDTVTLDIVNRLVDEIVVVDEGELRGALAGIVTREHVIVEGAGATAVAGLLSGRIDRLGAAAAILSGANIDPQVLTGAVAG